MHRRPLRGVKLVPILAASSAIQEKARIQFLVRHATGAPATPGIWPLDPTSVTFFGQNDTHPFAFLRDLSGDRLREQVPELIRLHAVVWENRAEVRVAEMLQDDFTK